MPTVIIDYFSCKVYSFVLIIVWRFAVFNQIYNRADYKASRRDWRQYIGCLFFCNSLYFLGGGGAGNDFILNIALSGAQIAFEKLAALERKGCSDSPLFLMIYFLSPNLYFASIW